MDHLYSLLSGTDKTFFLQSFSALDHYYRLNHDLSFYFLTNASLPELAGIFDTLEFHGMENYDVCIPFKNHMLFFQISDSFEKIPQKYFSVQNLLFDTQRHVFLDKTSIYKDLRSEILTPVYEYSDSWHAIADEALLYTRYIFKPKNRNTKCRPNARKLSIFEQRHLLLSLLSSRNASTGLQFLYETGFIAAHWPELAAMGAVQQTKDYHPEGNVWEHICEALKYRKQPDILLSLGILLHDLGKTVSQGSKDKPYENHAYTGSILGKNFLKKLLFQEKTVTAVMFLIQHHMMPEALPGMPLYRINKLLDSPLFPTLLELYRADLLATFQGPEKYYTACKLFKTYLKRRKNPYKDLKNSKRIII